MEKIKINFNEDLLIKLIHEHTVEVKTLGVFPQKVVNVSGDALFGVIHTVADCDLNTFIDYVNSRNSDVRSEREKFVRDERIDVLFNNMQQQGRFKEVGKEEIKNNPHVYYHIIEKNSSLKLS